ncbi:MAG: hypothetical protein MUO72_14360 [Bacteroidales bacterium]|nr:hypothetical protein [Bacteroidales bacterium]
MKKVFTVFLLIFMSISIISAQTVKEKKDPVGKWKFEAPVAPEGYTSGTMEIGFAEEKYSVTMTLPGIDYKFPGEKVKFENDSLLFSLSLEDEYVSINLKMEDTAKMSGKAFYSEGEIPLTLTREIIKETK